MLKILDRTKLLINIRFDTNPTIHTFFLLTVISLLTYLTVTRQVLKDTTCLLQHKLQMAQTGWATKLLKLLNKYLLMATFEYGKNYSI